MIHGNGHSILQIYKTDTGYHTIHSFFDFVEVDSTFYRIHFKVMVQNWYRRTPDNFRFAIKFPKIITHINKFSNRYQK